MQRIGPLGSCMKQQAMQKHSSGPLPHPSPNMLTGLMRSRYIGPNSAMPISRSNSSEANQVAPAYVQAEFNTLLPNYINYIWEKDISAKTVWDEAWRENHATGLE